MRITVITSLFIFLKLAAVFGQVYPIGHRSLNLTDASRSNRSIPTEVYYPATAQGDNQPVAGNSGNGFPVVVMGHGFSMPYDAYQNFWEELVPRGYIVALPTTESAIIPFPSHSDFGADLAFALQYLYQQGTNVSSPFYNQVLPKGAIMGHSMGGGATFLAAANNPNVTTIVGFAPAETNPSAISAAASISVPALIFIGSKDNVAGASGNATPMYNALAYGCKNYITITDGSHCQFAEANFTCEFGESTTCLGCSFISRAAQHAITFSFLDPWLDFFLKGQCDRFNDFQNLLVAGNGISHVESCNISAPPLIHSISLMNDTLFLSASPGQIEWYRDGSLISGAGNSWLALSQPGIYFAKVTDSYGCSAISDSVAFLPTGSGALLSPLVKIYPNPVNDQVYVNGSFDEAVLKNVLGKELSSITNETASMRLGGIAPGVYFLEIRKGGAIAVFKVWKN